MLCYSFIILTDTIIAMPMISNLRSADSVNEFRPYVSFIDLHIIDFRPYVSFIELHIIDLVIITYIFILLNFNLIWYMCYKYVIMNE